MKIAPSSPTARPSSRAVLARSPSGRPWLRTGATATEQSSSVASTTPPARLAEQVDAADDFELLAPVPLNVVCFRYRPPEAPEQELDDLNERIAQAVLTDGRIYVGTTRWAGKTAFRPAFVNWRTTSA